MKAVRTIAARELRALFDHPTGYILLIVFVAITDFMFFGQIFLLGAASLRPLLDLLPWILLFFVPSISGLDEKRPGYLLTPLLDLKCVGKIGFFSVVNQLSNLSLGKNCDKEWKKRIVILRRCSRLIGAQPRSWSKPACR